MSCLIADIGGTNSRCAIADPDGIPDRIEVFTNRDFRGPAELLRAYIEKLPRDRRPRCAVLAVAAPVRGDDVKMVNIDWKYSGRELRRELELDEIEILNDFEALAHALPALNQTQLRQIGTGQVLPDKPKVVLGPGTGLGVAGLIPTDGGWHAVTGEGGHVTLATACPEESRVVARVWEDYGHCSAERLISGPGLGYLHRLLHDTGDEMTPEHIAELADRGDIAAQESFEMFFRLFGTVAANVALILGAFGGIYIGGGIIPRNVERFVASGFRTRFESKGRYDDYLKSIPTFLITCEEPTLTGLGVCANRIASGN